MPQPIDLYFWPTPNGWKASIMLEELELPYNLHLVNIGKGEQFAPDFLKRGAADDAVRSAAKRAIPSVAAGLDDVEEEPLFVRKR